MSDATKIDRRQMRLRFDHRGVGARHEFPVGRRTPEIKDMRGRQICPRSAKQQSRRPIPTRLVIEPRRAQSFIGHDTHHNFTRCPV